MVLVHPRREGRTTNQVGKKGKSNGHWIVGVKLCALVNEAGRVVDWDAETTSTAAEGGHNVQYGPFQRMLKHYPKDGKMTDNSTWLI